MLQTIRRRVVTFLREQGFERQMRLPVFSQVTLVIRLAAEPPRLARVRKIDASALPRWQPTPGPIHARMRSAGRRPL